jgi:hypothetical protein
VGGGGGFTVPNRKYTGNNRFDVEKNTLGFKTIQYLLGIGSDKKNFWMWVVQIGNPELWKDKNV